MEKNNIMVTIYDSPNKFPPTLNTVHELCKYFNKVIVIWRGTQHELINLPENCIKYNIASPDLIQANIFIKAFVWIKFILKIIKLYKRYAAKWVLCYDSYSLSASLATKIIHRSVKIWYHNHDVTDPLYIRKFSLNHFCWILERKFINYVSLFSLPDLSRSKYFKYHNKIHFLPNYPNLNYNPVKPSKQSKPNILNIIYQGRVSEGHGIYELIKYLNRSQDNNIHFHIIGSYDKEFQEEINSFIEVNDLHANVFLHSALPYNELIHFTKNFDVGLGVLQPINIAYSTAASASNKIYEYAALGMPVILFDSDHYKKTLKKYKWAKFTNLSKSSFDNIFADLLKSLEHNSEQAYLAYRDELHFEKHFLKIFHRIIS